MKLTPEQRKEMLVVAKPLIQWLAKNCHPHCQAEVDSVGVTLLEGVASEKTFEFLEDGSNDERGHEEIH